MVGRPGYSYISSNESHSRVPVRLRGFDKLTKVDEALKIFFSSIKTCTLEAEQVSLRDALMRVCAEDVVAKQDVPPFDRSAVDGYALRASDTFGADEFHPRFLKLKDKGEISEGEAMRIWTGDPIPKGADAVVMLEFSSEENGRVKIIKQVVPGENICLKGEDVKKGEVIVKAGRRIRFDDVGLMAAAGISEVKVVRKPRVAVLSTGNELMEVGSEPSFGKIVDVNRLMISGMIKELGAEFIDLGIAKDDVDEICKKVSRGLELSDLVLTTGGISVGARDVVPDAINKLGMPGVIVHGIAMRPGKPTGLAVVGGKPIIMLSGNPVAAVIGFEVFARPLILSMMGLADEARHSIKARLTRNVAGSLGLKVFLRALVYEEQGEIYAEPISVRGAGIISTLTKCNAYIIIPEDRKMLYEGEYVKAYMLKPLLVR